MVDLSVRIFQLFLIFNLIIPYLAQYCRPGYDGQLFLADIGCHCPSGHYNIHMANGRGPFRIYVDTDSGRIRLRFGKEGVWNYEGSRFARFRENFLNLEELDFLSALTDPVLDVVTDIEFSVHKGLGFNPSTLHVRYFDDLSIPSTVCMGTRVGSYGLEASINPFRPRGRGSGIVLRFDGRSKLMCSRLRGNPFGPTGCGRCNKPPIGTFSPDFLLERVNLVSNYEGSSFTFVGSYYYVYFTLRACGRRRPQPPLPTGGSDDDFRVGGTRPDIRPNTFIGGPGPNIGPGREPDPNRPEGFVGGVDGNYGGADERPIRRPGGNFGGQRPVGDGNNHGVDPNFGGYPGGAGRPVGSLGGGFGGSRPPGYGGGGGGGRPVGNLGGGYSGPRPSGQGGGRPIGNLGGGFDRPEPPDGGNNQGNNGNFGGFSGVGGRPIGGSGVGFDRPPNGQGDNSQVQPGGGGGFDEFQGRPQPDTNIGPQQPNGPNGGGFSGPSDESMPGQENGQTNGFGQGQGGNIDNNGQGPFNPGQGPPGNQGGGQGPQNPNTDFSGSVGPGPGDQHGVVEPNQDFNGGAGGMPPSENINGPNINPPGPGQEPGSNQPGMGPPFDGGQQQQTSRSGCGQPKVQDPFRRKRDLRQVDQTSYYPNRPFRRPRQNRFQGPYNRGFRPGPFVRPRSPNIRRPVSSVLTISGRHGVNNKTLLLTTIPPNFVTQAGRIINGVPAKRGSWPWQASIRYKGVHSCGGSLINDRYVVTASHCQFGRRSPSDITVSFGTVFAGGVSDEFEQIRTASLIIENDQFNQGLRFNNDVALLKLQTPVEFNDYVSPICLPTKPPTIGSLCYVTGYGATKGTGAENILHEVALPIISPEQCSDANWLGDKINGNMICAGGGDKDSCQGDSGGPLQCLDESIGNVWTLTGVVSWGIDCGKPTKPGVYTNLFNYMGWINQNTQL